MKYATKSYYSGMCLILLATLFFAFKPILVRMALERGLSPEPLAVLRLGVALPLFLLTIFILGDYREMRLNSREFLFIGLVSIAGMGGAMVFSFYSIMYLGASVSTLVIFVFPAITTLLAYFLNGQPVTSRKKASLGGSFAGLVLVVLPLSGGALPVIAGGGGTAPVTGLLFSMLTALCWASTQVAFEIWLKKKSPFVTSVYTTGLMFIFFLAIEGAPPMDLDAGTWGVVVMLGTVSWYIPFLMVTYGIKRIGASNSAIIQSLGPALTVLIAWIALGESLSPVQLAGMILLIFAVLLLKNEAGTMESQPEHILLLQKPESASATGEAES